MTVNTEQLYYILDATPAEQNIMLVGKHGIGKSKILEDYYSEKGLKVVTLFLGQMADPGDLIGLPEKDEKTGKTNFMLPYWFPTDGEPIVLFLDELNRARPEVLQTIMDLTLNRKLAGKTLPEGSRIISAVNSGNEYQLTDLDPALISRFNIYTFEPTVEDWLNWAFSKNIDNRIINFIQQNPELLDGNDLEANVENIERTPDRRSWERASKIIQNFKNLTDKEKPIVSGIIGNRATSLFFRFVMENNVPSAQEILLSKENDFTSLIGKINMQDLTNLNESLFRYLQSGTYKEQDKKVAAKNLNKYFLALGNASKKELQSHFASLCSAESYPSALVFISENAPELYENLMNFITDL